MRLSMTNVYIHYSAMVTAFVKQFFSARRARSFILYLRALRGNKNSANVKAQGITCFT